MKWGQTRNWYCDQRMKPLRWNIRKHQLIELNTLNCCFCPCFCKAWHKTHNISHHIYVSPFRAFCTCSSYYTPGAFFNAQDEHSYCSNLLRWTDRYKIKLVLLINVFRWFADGSNWCAIYCSYYSSHLWLCWYASSQLRLSVIPQHR